MKNFLRSTYYDGLKPVLLALVGVYSVLAVMHYFVLPAPAKEIMMTIAGTSAICLASCYFAMRRFRSSLENHAVTISALVIVGIPVINTLAHIYLLPDAKQTTNLIIILLVSGILILGTRWFLFVTLTAIAGWALILIPQIELDDQVHYGVALAMSFTGSLVVHLNRKKILNNLIESRRLQAEKNEELVATHAELENTIEDLTRAKEAAEAAAIAKEQFLSNMSHELRTPLNAVIGMAQLLQLNEPREDQVEDLNTLQYSADNLLQLITDILDFSKINAGKLELEEESFDPTELISQLERTYRFQAEGKGLAFIVTRQGFLPKRLIGDALRLRQVLHNLLSNALKFTTAGSVDFTIKCTYNTNHTIDLEFVVKDTGIGIDPAKLQDIFEPFKQADGGTTRKYGGSGLGLAITGKLIELFGSELEVNSAPGQGSVFSFSLNFVPDSDGTTTPLSERPATMNLTGMNVLAVDDNAINLNMITKILQGMGAAVHQALSGQQAIEMVQNGNYHLVMMDVQMPEMDGLEATRQIRQLPGEKYQTLKILALTAASGADLIPNIHTSGMDGYVFKPFKQEELVEKLKSVLE